MEDHRVWTKNWDGTYTIMNDWSTKGQCKKMILGRWGHWPPWAYISKAKSTARFIRYNGE